LKKSRGELRALPPAMLRTRTDREADESRRLATYAQRVADTAGRAHFEVEHEFRTAYERDRARIIHSRAFRRLEYKTQVFLNGTGDHLRTRLTHTIEVASVSRSIALALGANEDLAESIALAHDLGHPPFGHAGEETLDALMRSHGGFEHNRQSLRVVQWLERKFTELPGLNLSYEVIEGLRKHGPREPRPAFTDAAGRPHPPECFSQPSLEAQIANAADEIAYYSHDLDDGLDSALLSERQLVDLRLWQRVAVRVAARLPHTSGKEFRFNVIRTLTDTMAEDVIRTTHARLAASGIASSDDVRRHDGTLVGQDRALADETNELRRFLYENLYHHPEVRQANSRACSLLEKLFRYYIDHPQEIGSHTASRLESDGVHRCICDYISGMTDRYLIDQARTLGL
jgi:dGTPase